MAASICCRFKVSTHSRPKAAGLDDDSERFAVHGFNTQPPEGGWMRRRRVCLPTCCFNTQPPEGGWDLKAPHYRQRQAVSTHSRPKAAGFMQRRLQHLTLVSTHSRPKAAGGYRVQQKTNHDVSTHSRPKAAGTPVRFSQYSNPVSTHSRPKAAGCHISGQAAIIAPFQHTAARRRLGGLVGANGVRSEVSTHSRPKAAGLSHVRAL